MGYTWRDFLSEVFNALWRTHFYEALWQHCILCVSGPGRCVEIYSSKKSSANVSTQKIKCVCLCSCVARPWSGWISEQILLRKLDGLPAVLKLFCLNIYVTLVYIYSTSLLYHLALPSMW